jgi:chromosome segregation ATPase
MELYNYSQGGTLENLRYENSLEKGQIDQLLLKLKEKENLQEDLEGEVNEISDTIAIITKRLKELDDRNAELEKEIKVSKTKNKD